MTTSTPLLALPDLWTSLRRGEVYMHGRVGDASWVIALPRGQNAVVFQVVFGTTEDRTIVSNYDVFARIVTDALEGEYTVKEHNHA